MRFMFAALLALALGLLPAGKARADSPAAAPAAMSCHGQSGDMSDHRQVPSHDMQACAQHCLSQVNGQANFVRLSGPSLQNIIVAEHAGATSSTKARLKDAPDTPPPRI